MAPRNDLVRRVTQALAELRRQQEVTQEALAELLDVPVQHVSRIEAGQNVTLATLERIATALGQKVIIVFEPTGAGPKKPAPSKRQVTKSKRKKVA